MKRQEEVGRSEVGDGRMGGRDGPGSRADCSELSNGTLTK